MRTFFFECYLYCRSNDAVREKFGAAGKATRGGQKYSAGAGAGLGNGAGRAVGELKQPERESAGAFGGPTGSRSPGAAGSRGSRAARARGRARRGEGTRPRNVQRKTRTIIVVVIAAWCAFNCSFISCRSSGESWRRVPRQGTENCADKYFFV